MNIREKVSEVIGKELHPIQDDLRDCTHKFYYKAYPDNLICKMDSKHLREYSAGDGGELEGSGNKPAKMASIASSSAMTFNILGNLSSTIKAGQQFAAGQYDISYEKQMYTLCKGSKSANLDAFLSNKDAREAIFCEMKMLEWLSSPGPLKASYFDQAHHFCPEAFEVFHQIACALRKSDQANEKNAYPSVFKLYDAWQMFKHTLSIYNASSHKTKAVVEQKNPGSSLAGAFDKITLVNVVFEMDTSYIVDPLLSSAYSEALSLEHAEADAFIDTMLAPEFGLVKLFRKDCRVDFDIRYMSVARFVECFDKKPEELSALRRYCVKG